MPEVKGWRRYLCRLVADCYPSQPAPVGGLRADPSAGSGEVSVSWDAQNDPDVAWYRLYRARKTGGPYELGFQVSDAPDATLPTGRRGVVDIGLDGRRWYVVSAVTSDGREGSASVEVSGAPIGVP